MDRYDTQQVCLNGHQITTHFYDSPNHRETFCSSCGAETIHQCPHCSVNIKGHYHMEGVFGYFETPVPPYCENCGKAFPWTENKQTVITQTEGATKNDPFMLVQHLCSRFHLIVRQLRNRHSGRNTLEVNDEYDVQDLLHSLLHIYFDDIRPEDWCPSYAGGSSRVDFLLKNEEIIIEVKKTRATLKAKNVGDELLIDMQRYKAHPNCKKLICFVYDPDGWISNPRGLEKDLNRTENDFEVKVLIVPKGH